jgi:hypothetical protein
MLTANYEHENHVPQQNVAHIGGNIAEIIRYIDGNHLNVHREFQILKDKLTELQDLVSIITEASQDNSDGKICKKLLQIEVGIQELQNKRLEMNKQWCERV